MSAADFSRLVDGAKLGQSNNKYFPLWVRRYAASMGIDQGRLPVDPDKVIGFLRSLLKSNTPAWQRLQAVRAIEAYRNLVLQTAEPSLDEIRQKLSRLADQEQATGDPGVGAGRAGVEDERKLIGQIHPREPAVMQQMRSVGSGSFRPGRWPRIRAPGRSAGIMCRRISSGSSSSGRWTGWGS